MAKIKLQNLLNQTIQRLALSHKSIITSLPLNDNSSFEMIYKWGCDGSLDYSLCKQVFSESIEKTDSDILLTSVVPLRMCVSYGENSIPPNKQIIWQNSRTSFSRFCRPIRFQFLKETTKVISKEFECIK